MKRWAVRGVIILAIACLGYAVYMRVAPHGGEPGMQGAMMGGGAAPVDVAVAAGRKVQIWHEFSGRLVAVDQAEIRPRVSGMIDAVLFTAGGHVNKGDKLFKIDPRPYQAAVAEAEGEVAAAKAQLDLAQSDFDRAASLFKEKAISQRDYDQRKNELENARARLESASAALEAAQLNLDYTDVNAPISGRVGRAEITGGNIVQAGPNAPVLTSVVADRPVYADFEMDEASFLQYANLGPEELADIPVRLGLSLEEDTPHTGRIDSFDNRLDPASGTIRVRAVFDNEDGSLVPGLFALINIGLPEKTEVVLISDKAIGTDQDKKFVYVVGGDNKVEYRLVQPGTMVEGLRVIDKGLDAGEKVVVGGLQRIRPGAEVMPQLVDVETGKPLEDAAEKDPR